MEGLQARAAMMRKHPGVDNDRPGIAHAGPGHMEEIVWQFAQPDTFRFAAWFPGMSRQT